MQSDKQHQQRQECCDYESMPSPAGHDLALLKNVSLCKVSMFILLFKWLRYWNNSWLKNNRSVHIYSLVISYNMKGEAISVLSLDISGNMAKFVRCMTQAHIFTAKIWLSPVLEWTYSRLKKLRISYTLATNFIMVEKQSISTLWWAWPRWLYLRPDIH